MNFVFKLCVAQELTPAAATGGKGRRGESDRAASCNTDSNSKRQQQQQQQLRKQEGDGGWEGGRGSSFGAFREFLFFFEFILLSCD